MKRFLTHIIIFGLLVVSPVSFSTDKIKNFYILVTINAPLKESRRASIVITHRVASTTQPSVNEISTRQSFFQLPTLPSIDSTRIIEQGRAPPVVPSA
jgi:hypothetical protein